MSLNRDGCKALICENNSEGRDKAGVPLRSTHRLHFDIISNAALVLCVFILLRLWLSS